MAFKLKKGDLVEVISGKDKGTKGKILKVLTQESRVLVEGVNKVKRHTKPSQAKPQGGIFEKEAPVHISNVLAVDPKTNKGARLQLKVKGEKKIRVFAKSGAELK